jgi:pteridine reductase
MRERDGGTIIQLGDWMGVRPVPRYLSYCVSKSGIGALTQALAKALAPKVRVNAVAPGPVLLPEFYSEDTVRNITIETPLRRIGTALDVARAVKFLACSSFITGVTYMVDGGWLARVDLGKETSV